MTNGIIEGLKIDVSGEELIGHMKKKSREHLDKSKQYQKQASDVSALQPSTGQTNDPASSLQASAREHLQKAELFDFIAQHLDPRVSYRLSEQDLIRVEIILNRW